MTNSIIPADNRLNIRIEPDRWELYSTELENPTTLVTANPSGVVVHPIFVIARDLPSGAFTPAQVARVVLGWAPESNAWRLGMLLVDGNVTKYDTLQMHWCELASWAEADAESTLKFTGQALARILNRPFQVVEPDSESRVAAFARVNAPSPNPITLSPETKYALDRVHRVFDTQPTTAQVKLSDLPLEIATWRLEQTGNGVRWFRTRGWWMRHFGRIGLFLFLSSLFLVLGIGSQSSGFADVDPVWLPNAGLGIAGLLLAILALQVVQMIRAGAVVLDGTRGEIYERLTLLPVVNWRVTLPQIQYLVLSQTPARAQGRPRRDVPMNIAHEGWLHLYDGKKFYEIAAFEHIEGRSMAWDEKVRQHHHYAVRRKLDLTEYDTPAHHAAMHLAQRLGVPVYLDIVV